MGLILGSYPLKHRIFQIIDTLMSFIFPQEIQFTQSTPNYTILQKKEFLMCFTKISKLCHIGVKQVLKLPDDFIIKQVGAELCQAQISLC